MFCREQVAQLRDAHDAIVERGARLLVVGNGTPAMARDFAEGRDVPFELVVDPSRKTYRTAGFNRSGGRFLIPRILTNGARATGRGFRQGRTRGDPVQLGGVLVIAPPGEVKMHFVSETAGDHPTTEDILRALG